jgi:acyl phosphate:glycerol-3-phosphate acyltransferase
MNIFLLIGILIVSYLLGSIPFAYLIAKWAKGIDLRKVGSGNVGFSNVAASVSKWAAVPVLLFDIGKGLLAVYIARWAGLPLYAQALAGLAAQIGHCWPVFLGFSAGRGILTIVGSGLGMEPALAAFMVGLSFLGIPFHGLATTSLIAILCFPVTTWLSDLPFLNLFINRPLGNEKLAVALVLLAWWIVLIARRLTVPRSPLAAGISTGRLLFNRFFFDRDIRDRKLWLQQNKTAVRSGVGK